VTILDDRPTAVSGRLDALVRDLLVEEGYPNRTEVTVHTVDAVSMAERNREAFGIQRPTDVLSFPVDGLMPGVVPDVADDGPPIVLGDVFIAPTIVAERASVHGFDEESELALMAVHGVLHLLGYDHAEPEDEKEMFELQRQLLLTFLATRGRPSA